MVPHGCYPVCKDCLLHLRIRAKYELLGRLCLQGLLAPSRDMLAFAKLLATVSTALRIKRTLLAFVTQRQDVIPGVFIEENVNNWISVMLYVL
jgi:hypothetical protein